MTNERNSKADQVSAAQAVSSLIAHHRIKVPKPVRSAMESLHLSATRAERRRKNAKSDAERIRDLIASRTLRGKSVPSATEIATTTKIPLKHVHAQLAMMKKRAKG